LSNTRILYIADSDLSKPGGAQQSMKVLINALRSEYDFFIITPNGKKTMKEQLLVDKYNDFKLRGKSVVDILKMIRVIMMEIRKVSPDIIHVQMSSSLVIVNLLLKLNLINKNIKIIYTDRGVYGKYGKITTLSINDIIKKADKVITTTNVNKRNYGEYYNNYSFYKDKFEVIYNTAGEKFDTYDEGLKEKIRMKLSIKEETLVVGFCGRFSEQKNWPMAKRIIELSYEKSRLITYVIILGTDGSEIENTKALDYLQELKNLIGEENIRGYINVNNDEVSELYYAFDLFLVTSKWESFGRTAVEAMSRKNIVLATDIDGLSEVIGDQRFLFKEELGAVKKIIELIEDENLRNSAIDYFYNRYHQNYGSIKNIESYRQLYKEISNSKNKGIGIRQL